MTAHIRLHLPEAQLADILHVITSRAAWVDAESPSFLAWRCCRPAGTPRSWALTNSSMLRTCGLVPGDVDRLMAALRCVQEGAGARAARADLFVEGQRQADLLRDEARRVLLRVGLMLDQLDRDSALLSPPPVVMPNTEVLEDPDLRAKLKAGLQDLTRNGRLEVLDYGGGASRLAVRTEEPQPAIRPTSDQLYGHTIVGLSADGDWLICRDEACDHPNVWNLRSGRWFANTDPDFPRFVIGHPPTPTHRGQITDLDTQVTKFFSPHPHAGSPA